MTKGLDMGLHLACRDSCWAVFGQRLWSEADHLQLHLAWQQRTQLPALAQLFELPEILIVRAL